MTFRSTDPTVFDDLDGIVVDESAPAPSVSGVNTNVAICVGVFERGPVETLTSIGSTGELDELFGKNPTFAGRQALKNKKFGRLKVIRVDGGSSAKATYTFDDGSATDIITFTAKYPGVYGNSITVTIAAGSTSGKKYTIQDTGTYKVLPTEVYDNVVITAVTAATFAASKLVDVTVDATSAEPANAAATNLASGSAGTVADTDYQAAIAVAEALNSGNFLFLDSYNATRNGYLKTHAANAQDKMCIMAGAEGDSVATSVTAVGTLRDADGRLIYAVNWPQTTLDGASTYTSPASWVASVLSQTGPNIDPAFAGNTQYLAGITGLKQTFSRSDLITLKEAGIMAFEFDGDIGFKIRSGITTQIANSSKVTVLRRRMADYLTNSIARFLKNYQNAVNSADNRTAVKGAILDFIAREERNGLLPKDSEVSGGRAKLVDTTSLNTDDAIAQGFFYVLYRQRIYSSMRFIVLRAEIGESVVVTEQ